MKENTQDAGFIRLAGAVGAGVLLSDTVRTVLGTALLPFLLAYMAARLVRPAGVFLSRKARVREDVGCVVFGGLLFFAVCWTLVGLSGQIWRELRDVLEEWPQAAEIQLEEIAGRAEELLPFLRRGGERSVAADAFRKAAAELGGAAAARLGNAVTGFPGGVVSAGAAVIAFFYLTADPKGAGESLCRLLGYVLPADTVQKLVRGFDRFGEAVSACLRAYGMLLLVTFAELAAGLSFLGVDKALAAALLIALVDALPVLGCGTVLVPWAVGSFLTGEAGRGMGLLVLLGLVYAVRQFLEPRLLGRASGVHPFTVLVVLFAGWKTGGLGGMLLAPVLLLSAARMRAGEPADGK